jgi:hypothetical protein
MYVNCNNGVAFPNVHCFDLSRLCKMLMHVHNATRAASNTTKKSKQIMRTSIDLLYHIVHGTYFISCYAYQV